MDDLLHVCLLDRKVAKTLKRRIDLVDPLSPFAATQIYQLEMGMLEQNLNELKTGIAASAYDGASIFHDASLKTIGL